MRYVKLFEAYIAGNSSYVPYIPEIVQYVTMADRKEVFNSLANEFGHVPGFNVDEYVRFLQTTYESNQTALVTAILNGDINTIVKIAGSIADQIYNYAAKVLSQLGFLKKTAIRIGRPNKEELEGQIFTYLYELGGSFEKTQDLINQWAKSSNKLGPNPSKIPALDFKPVYDMLTKNYTSKFSNLISTL